MINNYLIMLLMALGIIAAGLAVGARRPRAAAGAAVVLGAVAAILTIINWVEST